MDIKGSNSSRLHLQTPPIAKWLRLTLWGVAVLPWLQLLLFLSIFPLIEKAFRLEILECKYQAIADIECKLDYVGRYSSIGKTR